ncbi:phage NrS-1 polymerase family protein, partial [Enterococcus faecium]|uniref:phage NrS-1 polymerase family protein n=1 Tax=Enterococcus faecium TaxID=1352 RepID=UPI002930BA18
LTTHHVPGNALTFSTIVIFISVILNYVMPSEVFTLVSSIATTRFKVFMNGGWEAFYSSQSEADMAFANDLAFWTGRDFEKMDEI